MTPDPFDPARVGRPVTAAALDRLTRAAPGRLPRPATGEQYLGGPIPAGWLTRAAGLPGKALQLGVAVWFAAVRSKTKNPAVTLTAALNARFGLSARPTRARALKALAAAGLVAVEDRTGRPPVVTILPAPPDDAGPPAAAGRRSDNGPGAATAGGV